MNREEIIRMAREAGLSRTDAHNGVEVFVGVYSDIERFAALVAVAALAEPVQEPVRWMDPENGDCSRARRVGWTPLYTAPPQRKPLDDLAIADIYTKWDATPGTSMADFARAIERAHGIGENDG